MAFTSNGAGEARRSLMQSAGLIGLLTLMSRVLGFARDVISAKIFGTSGAWDAFLLAFTLPNFLRRLVGEGALASAFVPVYSEVLKERGREEADRVANIVFTLLSCFLGVFLLLITALIQWILSTFELPGKIELTLKLLQILFPYILFLGHVALSMGTLYCHKHFFTPSLAPVLLNIFWIFGVLWVCPLAGSLEGKAHLLAVTVLLSSVAQLGIQLFPLKKLGFRVRFIFEWFHPAIRKIYGLLLPSIMGFAVTQVSILIDMALAFLLGDGANASLWYGNRLMQFPLGLFGIAMGTALLPTFSEQAAEKNLGQVGETLSFSLRTTFFIVVPASVGLIFLRTPIVQVLFERGNFDALSTARTAATAAFYSIGLFGYSGQKMMTSVFYAIQDTKTPFLVSALAVAVDVVLNLVLMWPLREGGLALATAISGILNFLVLIFLFKKKVAELDLARIARSFTKIVLLSLAMGGMSYWIHQHVRFSFSSSMVNGIAGLTTAILVGIALYVLLSFIFRVEELGGILRTGRTPEKVE